MQRNIWATDDGVYLGFGVTPTEAPDHQSILDADWNATHEMHRYPNPADPKNQGDRHLVTIGPNGSGKTRRLLIPNLFRLKNWSIVVVDIKGELAAATAAHRASQRGHKVAVVDPFGVMKANYRKLFDRHDFLSSNGFNPVAALKPDSEEFPDDALALAEALVRVDSKEPYWAESAQDLIAALVMHARIKQPETCSLGTVRDMLGLSAKEFCDEMRLAMDEGVDLDCEALVIKASRFAELTSDNRELNSILSTALTQTRWLDSRPVRADLARGSFDFGSLKETPTTVYLILPPRYLATHSSWLRVLVTSALMPLLRSVEDAKVPVLFMLDEFAQMGQMPVIENNIALMRGYGIKLWPVLQDLAQAQALYEKRWESFIGNAGVVQSFAPQDMTTRNYLSQLSGQRLYWLTTHGISDSRTSGRDSSRSEGISEGAQNMPGPFYWPHGLGAMDLGQAVLFSRGHCRRAWLPDPEDEGDQLGYRALMLEARRSTKE